MKALVTIVATLISSVVVLGQKGPVCEIVPVASTANHIIAWRIESKANKATFKIEQFRWKKWVTLDTIVAVHSEGMGAGIIRGVYTSAPHFGENRFKISTIGDPYCSSEVFVIDHEHEERGFWPKKTKDKLHFSHDTHYEVIDGYGNVRMKGYGIEINVTALEKGLYHLNYDHKSDTFVKK